MTHSVPQVIPSLRHGKTQDRVTALGAGVDGAIRRIATTYELRGMVESITSYDNPTVGSGAVDNATKYVYDASGQLTTEYQEHGGVVNPSTSPKVQYGYADGSAGTVRPTSLTYPNGRVLHYDYGTSGGLNDALGRIGSLIDNDGATHLADYSYLGVGARVLPTLNRPFPSGDGRDGGGFVEVDYPQPDLKYTLLGTAGGNDPDTGDIYRGLDRFGRIKDSYWYDYGRSQDVDRILYGYDRSGNRTYREQTCDPNSHFDEVYGYDSIDRLKTMDRGPLNATKAGVTSLNFAQCWGLDATGNWRDFREDADGIDDWDLIQTREHNAVNEITDVNETRGLSWITPQYDRAGNMTRIPKPADPTQYFTCTYDAWNRLVKVMDGENTVAEYGYDGARRRIVKKTYAEGEVSETRHFYYTEPSKWQVLEERVGVSSVADRQFVWGLRYIDDLALRDRDTNSDGTLDERLHALQDANWNVTILSSSSGVIQERYAYSAYGTATVLDSSFGSWATSSYDWETLYAGRQFDAETLLYYYRNRYCGTDVGRFLARDPIGYEGGDENLYRYVRNIPMNAVDPSGLDPVNGVLCGDAEIGCKSGNFKVRVFGDSVLAAIILLGGSGCVTLPDGIYCTGSCKDIKNWKSADNPAKSILEHEACHMCALKDDGLCAYLKTAGPAPDGCVGKERPAKPKW